MEGIKIQIDYYPANNNIVIIRLSGYIDQSNSSELEALIHDLLHSNKKHFVFDLDQLVYMSSAGWGIFVGEIKNVRNAGGDIKVAAMSPEVYDVFQVLEFYHIFEDYAKIEEAIYSFIHTDFGGVEELEKVSSDREKSAEKKSEDNIYALSGSSNSDRETEEVKQATTESVEKTSIKKIKKEKPVNDGEIDISNLPAIEKARRIITIYPILNLWQIRKMMRHEKFGSTKIGIVKLYKILRENNLHNKKLRYRYYRSV